MFRIPGKEGTPAEKELEKKKARQQTKQQFLLFVGIVLTLKIGKSGQKWGLGQNGAKKEF